MQAHVMRRDIQVYHVQFDRAMRLQHISRLLFRCKYMSIHWSIVSQLHDLSSYVLFYAPYDVFHSAASFSKQHMSWRLTYLIARAVNACTCTAS